MRSFLREDDPKKSLIGWVLGKPFLVAQSSSRHLGGRSVGRLVRSFVYLRPFEYQMVTKTYLPSYLKVIVVMSVTVVTVVTIVKVVTVVTQIL